MKYFTPIIILLLMQHQCSSYSSANLSPKSNLSTEVETTEIILDDSLSNAMLLNCNLWLNSWNGGLMLDSFVFACSYTLPPLTWWENFDISEDTFFLYHDMLCYSPNGLYALDLYSSHIILSGHNKMKHATLDVDTKVHLIDTQHKQRMPILQCGSLESVDDGFWLSDSMVVFVGFETFLDNGNQTFQPYLLLVNVFDRGASEFRYNKVFSNTNEEFLRQKFPAIYFDY